jgi:hypothetical protein
MLDNLKNIKEMKMPEINQETFEKLGELTNITISTVNGRKYPGWIMACSPTTLYLGVEVGSKRIPLNEISDWKIE